MQKQSRGEGAPPDGRATNVRGVTKRKAAVSFEWDDDNTDLSIGRDSIESSRSSKNRQQQFRRRRRCLSLISPPFSYFKRARAAPFCETDRATATGSEVRGERKGVRLKWKTRRERAHGVPTLWDCCGLQFSSGSPSLPLRLGKTETKSHLARQKRKNKNRLTLKVAGRGRGRKLDRGSCAGGGWRGGGARSEQRRGSRETHYCSKHSERERTTEEEEEERA